MLRNVQRLRAQYHESVQDWAHNDMDRAGKGKDSQDGENLDDRMEEDDVGDTGKLALEARAVSCVRRQPETEQRLHRQLASVFRVLTVCYPDVALRVEHKENVHACYRMWSGQVPTRVGIKTIKASGTRSEANGGM